MTVAVVNGDDVVALRRARLEKFGVLGVVAEEAIRANRPLVDLLGPVPRPDHISKRGIRIVIERVWRRLYFERFFSTPQIANLFGVSGETVSKAVRRV